jgi:hypothetical protein
MAGSSDSFENTFSWSTNRSNLFRECKRKYYLNYYGYWEGWDSSSDERVQQIYLLKKLQNRHMWIGTLVHESIERVLKYLRSDRVLEEDEVVDQMVNRMREEFDDSRRGKYRLDPKNTLGLTEHEYGEQIDDPEWVRIREKGVRCLRNFFSSDTYRFLRSSAPEEWLAVEGDVSGGGAVADSFEMGDLTVWLKLDLAFRRADGEVEIVDWKTGKSDPDFRQLYCYGYYAWKVWGEDPSDITLTIEKLSSEERHQEPFSFDKLTSLEDTVKDDVVDMKELLVEPEENRAREEDFPMVDNLNICRNCRFRKICYPEGLPESQG